MKKNILLFFMCSFSIGIKAQEISKESILHLTQQYQSQAVETLVSFLAIPNNGKIPEQLQENLNWSENQLKKLGFSTTTLYTDGVPVLLAEKKAKTKTNTHIPTVLFYLQIDGQPVDPSQWDQENPYQAVLKRKGVNQAWETLSLEQKEYPEDSYLFARSASDSKGPAIALLTAFKIIKEEKIALPYHVKLILDFQEEMGSPSLAKAVKEHQEALHADYLFILDGARHLSNKPTLTFGARGIATAKWVVYGPKVSLHSGQYGNYAPNPVFEASRVLAGLKTPSGRVTLPNFYKGIEISEKDLRFLAAIQEDTISTNARLGIATREAIGSGYQEALQYPSLNIRGLQAGWVNEQVRTIIPDKVVVEMDMRLVPESDGKTLMESLKKYIEESGYFIIEGLPTEDQRAQYPKIANFSYALGSKPFRTPMDGPIALLLSKAMEKIFGEDYILMRTTGGSQPIAPFISTLNIPAVAIRIPNPDNNIHSPNENIRMGNFKEGIMSCLSILTTHME